MSVNELGRFTPLANSRVFDGANRSFYEVNEIKFDYRKQHLKAQELGFINASVDVTKVQNKLDDLVKTISTDRDYQNLLKGNYIPF